MDQSDLHHLRVRDRAELIELLKALHGAMNALRRDECGDPTIFGSRGHIRSVSGMYFVYLDCETPLAWTTWAKKKLAFAKVHQDGDQEGILILDRMPTETEAETIRRYIGLRQTRDMPPDRAQVLREPASRGV